MAPYRSSARKRTGKCCRSIRSTTKCSRRRCRRTANCSSARDQPSTTLRNSLIVLLALAAAPLVAQRPVDLRNRGAFRSASELIATAVTVRDGDGRLVTNLKQSDFTVEEDGVAQ